MFRSQTQHQYRLNFLSDEGLEGEVPLPPPEAESKEESQSESGEQYDGNTSLFDMLQSESRCSNAPAPVPTLPPHDDVMSSIVSDLLALDDNDDTGRPLQVTSPVTDQQRDLLTDEWDEYSAIDSSKPTAESEELKQPAVGDSDDWTDDLVEAEQPCTPRELNEEINELMAIESKLPAKPDPEEVVFDPLSAVSSVSNDLKDISIDSNLPTGIGNEPATQLIPARQLLPSMVPPVFPSPASQSTAPYTFNSSSRSPGYKPMVGGSSATNDSQAPGQKWANLFAHLDPIANEKA